MRKKKPFLVVFVAIVLTCSIPISACAFGKLSPYDEYLQYFTYNNHQISTSTSPWYHVFGHQLASNWDDSVYWEACGYARTGNPIKAFIMWIPFCGWYMVVVQNNPLRKDYIINDGEGYSIYTCGEYYRGTQYYEWQTTRSYYGDGTISSRNLSLFQSYILGYYFVFFRVQNSDFQKMPRTNAECSGMVTPSGDEQDAIRDFVDENSGIDKPFPALNPADITFIEGDETPTTPDGQEVMTNEHGNPIPTYPDGSPAPTYPNGNPAPTYPDGTPAPTYPNGNVVPSTVYDGDFGSELNTEFSKLYSLVNDLEQASSIMESNAEIMSSHCDSTRTLLNDVIGWLPSSIVACLVCGCIMIIAVKITGSGKS